MNMHTTEEHIETLIVKHLQGVLTAQEAGLLEVWQKEKPENKLFFAQLTDQKRLTQKLIFYHQNDQEAALHEAMEHLFPEIAANTRIQRIPSLLKWVAAAILILTIGSGIYYLNNQSYKSPQTTLQTKELQPIQPGSNKATLIINNNQNIDLATNKTGININNTITYNDGERIADAGQLLQLTTPRGGQYQAVLPDGSKVWLNAASSVKFPSKFNNNERRVEVTGEVYFEIVKNKEKPFIVTFGKEEILVLGTSFNINNYADESYTKTSLVEGSIKINGTILQPGKAYSNGKIISTDLQQDIAWKNGYFSFQNLSLQQVMKQVERWYDVQIKYEGAIPAVLFTGEMDRGVQISGLIRFLTDYGIRATLQGRTLIIHNR